MNESKFLTVEKVDVTFDTPKGPLTVLEGASFDVARGEVVALIGHSGCGKSTLLNVIAGLNRAIERIYPDVTIDVSGGEGVDFLGERQDFEEMVGNLIDNAAKYGGGRVFVSVEAEDAMLTVIVEDDGKGIDTAARTQLFERGARLDTGKPGTGLGLAIVKDVAEIYGGSVALGTSEELGGLEVRLTLPRALHA